MWLNLAVRGSGYWPREEMTVKVRGHDVILKPATKETEHSAHIELRRITEPDAFTLITRFLSVLSWCSSQPMEIAPLPGSIWRRPEPVRKQIPVDVRPLNFQIYRDIPVNPKARLALALYREAQTVNSVPFSFLSYFKILNIFWKDGTIRGKNEIVEELRSTLPCLQHPDVVAE